MVAHGSDDFRGFVSEPDGRGTLNIVWSCLSVLLLNTWTVLHINIPSSEWKAWRIYLHKFKWSFIALLIPEGMIGIAYSQWRHAKISINQMKKHAPQWTIVHGFYAEMGGFKVQDENSGQRYTFRATQLAWLAEADLITIPEISQKDIKDRSKTSRLAKLLACAQSAWFLLSTLARIVQSLPLTTLEIATLPFIGCTWLIYFFWWHKPMDLETSTTIHVPHLLPRDLQKLTEATCFSEKRGSWYRPAVKEKHQAGWDFYWFEKSMDLRHFKIENTNHLIPDELHNMVKHSTAETRVAHWYRPAVNEFQACEWDNANDVALIIGGWFFNGLHLIAWNNQFPSIAESLLWKISVCLMLGYIAFSMPLAAVFSWLPEGSPTKDLPLWGIVVCYAITRLYLIVEVFVGFRACPPAVYQTVEWSQFIPKIS